MILRENTLFNLMFLFQIGKWVHPEIDNPEYNADDAKELGKFDEVCKIGFDLWQVKSGTIFDNILITDDVDEAKKIGDETWGVTKDAEKKMKDEQDEAEKAKAESEAKEAEPEEEEEDDDEDLDEIDDEKEEEVIIELSFFFKFEKFVNSTYCPCSYSFILKFLIFVIFFFCRLMTNCKNAIYLKE